MAGPASLLHVAEPLERDQRLDPRARAVRVRHVVRVGLGAGDAVPPRAAPRPPLARLLHRQALVRSPAAAVMSPSSPITEISSRPCLRPISKSLGSWPGVIFSAPVPNSGLHVLVGDDRQPAAHQRQDRRLADQARVALVVGMHRDRGVGQHRLRAHRGHGDRARARLQRVVDHVERVLHVALLDLEVRDRRAGARVPVDHVVVAVDQALLVQPHEHVLHRPRVRSSIVKRSSA